MGDSLTKMDTEVNVTHSMIRLILLNLMPYIDCTGKLRKKIVWLSFIESVFLLSNKYILKIIFQ